jgi:hypothetical protein
MNIVDPVLDAIKPLSSDSEDEPLDPEELKRIQEREKIRELKRRRIHGDPKLYGLSGLALRRPGNEAVFVRRDQEDESAEVDISMDDQDSRVAKSTGITTPSSVLEHDMDVDTPVTSVASPQSTHSSKMPMAPASSTSRIRRSTTKAAATRAPPVKNSIQNRLEVKAEISEAPKIDKKGKPKPETYKQAWSVEEQHLLERLLEEIPDGEKNRYVGIFHCPDNLTYANAYRWLKISQAMNGRRTARQVASRVQKYYEKLKRFGVDVNGSSSRGE